MLLYYALSNSSDFKRSLLRSPRLHLAATVPHDTSPTYKVLKGDELYACLYARRLPWRDQWEESLFKALGFKVKALKTTRQSGHKVKWYSENPQCCQRESPRKTPIDPNKRGAIAYAQAS